jgi:hypothetical protein
MRDSEPQAGNDRPLDLGVFGRAPGRSGPGAIEIVSLLLSLLWLAAVAAWVLEPGWQPSDQTASLVVAGMAVVLPLGVLWLAALTARHVRNLRDEAVQLRAMLETLRQAQIAQAQQGAAVPRAIASAAATLHHAAQPPGPTPPPARSALPPRSLLEEAQAAGAPLVAAEAPAPAFSTRRDARGQAPARPPAPPPAALSAEEQPSLALGTPPEAQAAPVAAGDVVRALNFPDSPDDAEGFRALRRALEDQNLARLIRAAQDVLTLLAQDGIYMDDLAADRARPELWRRFAEGARGREVAALGGVHDRETLATVIARMRQDTVFRDAAHHFLRQFDRSVSGFAATADDAALALLAETRTARAFMLIGRAAGTFD